MNYVDGVTSSIQSQLDSKEDTITGAATTIVSLDLTASRALLSNSSGKVAVSAVTASELGYLGGVTSGIQSQIDGITEFEPSNTGNANQILQRTASGYQWADASDASFTLTAATADTLGGVIVPLDSDIDIDSSGALTLGGISANKITSGTLPQSRYADVTASKIDAETSMDGYVLTSDGSGNVSWEAVSGTGHTIEDSGVAVTNRSALNFLSPFVVTDNISDDSSDISLSLAQTDIPNLSTGKITSGTFNAARLSSDTPTNGQALTYNGADGTMEWTSISGSVAANPSVVSSDATISSINVGGTVYRITSDAIEHGSTRVIGNIYEGQVLTNDGDGTVSWQEPTFDKTADYAGLSGFWEFTDSFHPPEFWHGFIIGQPTLDPPEANPLHPTYYDRLLRFANPASYDLLNSTLPENISGIMGRVLWSKWFNAAPEGETNDCVALTGWVDSSGAGKLNCWINDGTDLGTIVSTNEVDDTQDRNVFEMTSSRIDLRTSLRLSGTSGGGTGKFLAIDANGDITAETPVVDDDLTNYSSNDNGTNATDGYVLTADGSGGVAWEAASGGSEDQFADQQALEDFITNKADFRSDIGAGTVNGLSDLGITATSSELNVLDGVTATTTELNYIDGVTSSIQTQLDSKGTVSSLSDLSVTATAAELNVLDGVTATTTEINFLDGVTSSIQTQIDNFYSTGTWTPRAFGLTGANTESDLTTYKANYVKIGPLVTCVLYFEVPTNTSTEDLIIVNLPFNESSVNLNGNDYIVVGGWVDDGRQGGQALMRGVNRVLFGDVDNSGDRTWAAESGDQLGVQFTYLTDE